MATRRYYKHDAYDAYDKNDYYKDYNQYYNEYNARTTYADKYHDTHTEEYHTYDNEHDAHQSNEQYYDKYYEADYNNNEYQNVEYQDPYDEDHYAEKYEDAHYQDEYYEDEQYQDKTRNEPQWMNTHLVQMDTACDQVEKAIRQAIMDTLRSKCNSSQTTRIQYISPQELLSYLPECMNIDRDSDITKHHSGQWEVKNENIHCYFGFQVQTHDFDTNSLIKDLIRRNSQKHRYELGIEDEEDTKRDLGDCDVCLAAAKVDPRFGKHVCRVAGYFKCFNYDCNGRTFKIGICLLDPTRLKPPTRYKCANCTKTATFTRYDLRESRSRAVPQNNGESEHRTDLCEACDIWTDCRLSFVQPSAIFEALLDQYRSKSRWTVHKEGVNCSFSILVDVDEYGEYCEMKSYSFDIKPYAYCHFINTDQFEEYR